MENLIANSNIVVVANDVNLSIFKPLWLLKEGILTEEEIQGDVIVTPVAVQIPTTNFELSILPNRIQLTIPDSCPSPQEYIDRILVKIVSLLPHTPFSGVGLNFKILIFPKRECDFYSLNQRLFASEFANILENSKDTKSRFGSYISFDILDGRLKLDIKPVSVDGAKQQIGSSNSLLREAISLSFNFHFEAIHKTEKIEYILNALKRWDEAKEFAQSSIALLNKQMESNDA